jgi:hypothetical protein
MERAAAVNRMKYERKAGVFTYMRDTHNAQTVGDAEDKLRQHQVDPDIVRIWIEERRSILLTVLVRYWILQSLIGTQSRKLIKPEKGTSSKDRCAEKPT